MTINDLPDPQVTCKQFPNPVTLLRDDKGVYGIALSDEYLQARASRHGSLKLILRPDRVDETETPRSVCPPILQGLPRWHLKSSFNYKHEGVLRGEMIAVMRHRAGIPEDTINDEGRKTYSNVPTNLRRHWFGLPNMATRMFNSMVAQVVASADPKALRVGRRFPLAARWPIYKAAVHSQRALQLAEVFPLLAYRIFCDRDYQAGFWMIECGLKLRDIALACKLSMRLRQIKPGAVQNVSDVLINQPELLDHMPLTLRQQRQWVSDVCLIGWRKSNSDYVAWVARNWAKLDRHEIESLGDWACTDRLIERPFVPTMSVRTVRQLSAQWHEAIVHEQQQRESEPFPEAWFPAATLPTGEQIVPITDGKELQSEGRAMQHCVASYGNDILKGGLYVYSLRQNDRRIATIALLRDETGKAELGQIRGRCNAARPRETEATIRWWLTSQNGRAGHV